MHFMHFAREKYSTTVVQVFQLQVSHICTLKQACQTYLFLWGWIRHRPPLPSCLSGCHKDHSLGPGSSEHCIRCASQASLVQCVGQRSSIKDWIMELHKPHFACTFSILGLFVVHILINRVPNVFSKRRDITISS